MLYWFTGILQEETWLGKENLQSFLLASVKLEALFSQRRDYNQTTFYGRSEPFVRGELLYVANHCTTPGGKKKSSVPETCLCFFAASHTQSSFDNIYSGITFPSIFVHDLDTLAEIARILKPSGSLILRQPAG
jgi:hypothetical protein